MTSGIYEIVNLVTGRRYIGSSKNIQRRWYEHKLKLQNDSHHSPKLQGAWNKYGEHNFKFNILYQCSPVSDILLFYEQLWIDFEGCSYLYNIKPNTTTWNKPIYICDLSTMNIVKYDSMTTAADEINCDIAWMSRATVKRSVINGQFMVSFNIDELNDKSNVEYNKRLNELNRIEFKKRKYRMHHKIQNVSLEKVEKIIKAKGGRSLIQVDENGNIINRWISANQAAKSLNVASSNVSQSARFGVRCGDYYFVYTEEEISKIIDKNKRIRRNINSKKKIKKFYQIDKFSDIIVDIFTHPSEAASKNNIYQHSIIKCLRGNIKSYGGYIWRYVNEFVYNIGDIYNE